MSDRVVLITGAGRGIGLGLVKVYLEKGYSVAASARNPEKAKELKRLQKSDPNLILLSFDVTDESAIKEASRAVQKEWGHLDILINNAGIFGEKNQDSITKLKLEAANHVFDVNLFGPIRVTRAFLPLLEKGKEKKVIHITSLMGSIDDNQSGGYYAYRISKTALNMMNRSLSHELGKKGFICTVMHPGWVKTDMGGAEAPTPVEGSANGLFTTISRLVPEDSGRFLDYQGKRIPW
jgi:NAD(P)-dependent dehydrogenase (short-subunit alcohol dehydrogenase family)